MSRRFPSQPDELLRRWGTQVVPVDAPERLEQRRELVVDALSRAIRQNADRSQQKERARWVWALGVAASLALAVGAAFQLRHSAVDASRVATTVSELQGAVVVIESGQSRVLSRGSSLALHTVGEIETAPDGQAEIRSQKSLVRLSPATKLTVPQATSVEERYRLALGRVDVSVDKDSKLARSVVVETPNAEVVVHGTVFAVGVSPRAEHTVTEVSVTRGSVWVLASGVQVAVLGPGQHWSSEGQAASAQPTIVAGNSAAPVSASEPSAAPDPPRTARSASAAAEAKASTLAEQSRMFQEAIDARNRGDDAHAVELFTHLVTRYPGYEEAEVQLFRAEKRLGQLAAASAEARRYFGPTSAGFCP